MLNFFLWLVITFLFGMLITREFPDRVWVPIGYCLLLVPAGYALGDHGVFGKPGETLPVIVGVLVFATFETPWFWWCNRRTYRDMMRAIKWAYASSDWQRRSKLINTATYPQHLWRRITFRDPWKLYPPEVAQAMRRR